MSLGYGCVILMLLGTQWYILFNVIAGAMAIPGDLKEAATSFRLPPWHRMKVLYLPAIFPYLVTGWVTAAGGAWNASIVAEYYDLKGAYPEHLRPRGRGQQGRLPQGAGTAGRRRAPHVGHRGALQPLRMEALLPARLHQVLPDEISRVPHEQRHPHPGNPRHPEVL